MALPAAWNTRVVYGDHIDYPQGRPILGTGVAVATNTRRFIASRLTAFPFPAPFTIVSTVGVFEGETITTGHWEVTLPLSDDPDVDNPGAWTFTLALQGAAPLFYSDGPVTVMLTSAMPPRVRLSDLVAGLVTS